MLDHRSPPRTGATRYPAPRSDAGQPSLVGVSPYGPAPLPVTTTELTPAENAAYLRACERRLADLKREMGR